MKLQQQGGRNGDIWTDQRGMVSIVVTVILMLVISITVLGFAQIIRREQRQALDRQLSSQAFYAAESGINDARQIISSMPNPYQLPPKTQCGWTGDYPLNGIIDSSTDTSYSCLLVTGTPTLLKYDLSTTSPSKVFPVYSVGPVINSLDVEWTPPKDVAGPPQIGCSTSVTPSLPAATSPSWSCGYGLLRVDLVPTQTLDRQALMANDFVSFLTPTTNSGSSSVQYNGNRPNIYGGLANQGSRPAASCTSASCKITIKGLSGTRYYMRVSTLYRDATVSVTAKDAAGGQIQLTGAQVMIDATGKANDVLRRVQVRIPLVHDGPHADYGIESTDSMCKQFMSGGGNMNTASPCS